MILLLLSPLAIGADPSDAFDFPPPVDAGASTDDAGAASNASRPPRIPFKIQHVSDRQLTGRLIWRTARRNNDAGRQLQLQPPQVQQAVHLAQTAFEDDDQHVVGQAAEFRALDPFLDPFGDRIALQPEAAELPAINQPDAGQLTPGPASTTDELPTLPSVAGAPELESVTDESPPAFPLGDDVESADRSPRFPVLHEEGALPGPATTDAQTEDLVVRDGECDRVYNDRNCCKEDRYCDEAFHILRDRPITSISIDITPRFEPDENRRLLGDAELEREQAETLAGAGSRTWRNRAGDVIAEGVFTDLRAGLLHITSDDQQVQKIDFRDLSNDDLCFATAWWGVPTECLLQPTDLVARNCDLLLTWKASALCHKPLYFEQVGLERYGHSLGPWAQPVVSGAHFFAKAVTLPYQMAMYPPYECQYALGYYRPGSCAPYLVPPVPLSWHGAAAQSGVVLGLIYAIP